MKYEILQADETMLDDIYKLYENRIEWMDEVGIKQWNVTDYLKAYPKSYYKKQISENRLYVMMDNIDNKIVGAIVLLEQDDIWEDSKNCSAYYLHNLETDVKTKGIGTLILNAVDDLAEKNNKQRLRLDCAEDNEFLNNYYEYAGYFLVGKCAEGLFYKGNRREKVLKGGHHD